MTSIRRLPSPAERGSRQGQFLPGHAGGRVASAQPVHRFPVLRRQAVGAAGAAGEVIAPRSMSATIDSLGYQSLDPESVSAWPGPSTPFQLLAFANPQPGAAAWSVLQTDGGSTVVPPAGWTATQIAPASAGHQSVWFAEANPWTSDMGNTWTVTGYPAQARGGSYAAGTGVEFHYQIQSGESNGYSGTYLRPPYDRPIVDFVSALLMANCNIWSIADLEGACYGNIDNIQQSPHWPVTCSDPQGGYFGTWFTAPHGANWWTDPRATFMWYEVKQYESYPVMCYEGNPADDPTPYLTQANYGLPNPNASYFSNPQQAKGGFDTPTTHCLLVWVEAVAGTATEGTAGGNQCSEYDRSMAVAAVESDADAAVAVESDAPVTTAAVVVEESASVKRESNIQGSSWVAL